MLKIRNAKDRPLSETLKGGLLPDMSDVIPGWFQPLSFGLLSKGVIDFEETETVENVSTMGMVQPMSPQHISIRPEGQRAWKWKTLHCLADISLKPDDIVVIGGERYRVMAKLDYSEYGYCEYHICGDYGE